MKRHWKIIVGAVFLIGGFGCITSDIGAAIFGVVVGTALIVWWYLSLKKSSVQDSSAEKKDSGPVVSSNYSITNQAAQSPIKPPASQLPPPVHQPVMQIPPSSTKTKEVYDVVIPEKKDGAPLAYRYSVPFVPSDINDVLSAAKAERWYLSAKQIGSDIHLLSEEADLGILTERADMVSDWLRRDEPFLVILERVNSEAGCTVMLVFYRDRLKYYANREQTVTALTAFKAESKQDILSCLEETDELELEENWDKEDSVAVVYMGDTIGNLPKKYAQRYISDGAALVVLDHMEEDDEFIKKPYVRIYW